MELRVTARTWTPPVQRGCKGARGWERVQGHVRRTARRKRSRCWKPESVRTKDKNRSWI